ncbi:MAG: precorrin-4 C(11)-methyltransferase [Aestuariivita sp.]|nr:precorrin-4 C(11)-methyltransferase [Aestuariivita sp.]
MTVHFIGAGPGAPDLLTLRGRDILASCQVCLYAGSLVPKAVLEYCLPNTRIVNTAPMSLDDIINEIKSAHFEKKDIARLHSGDLSVYSALGEQLRLLRQENIPFTITPGVPSFAAAAAALGAELTLPEVTQSVVLTRTQGRASSMPDNEALVNFAKTGATLAIHLSIQNLERLIADITPYYGVDCPIAIIYRASWPDQKIIMGTLDNIVTDIDGQIERTAMILVGPVLNDHEFANSCLYSDNYDRRYRPRNAESRWVRCLEDEEQVSEND